MKNSMAMVAAVVILFLVISCGGGKPVPAKYQGNWVGDNGTTIYTPPRRGRGRSSRTPSCAGRCARAEPSRATSRATRRSRRPPTRRRPTTRPG